jgi:gluconokinase
MQPNEPTFLLVMGVCGSGKSTIGKELAHRASVPFIDADDYHPQSNIEKMRHGEPLTDDDRWPWLEYLSSAVIKNQRGCVFACSALKKSYRTFLRERIPNLKTVYLHGSEETLYKRMQGRDHFMPESLLKSQLATLEIPSNEWSLTIEIDQARDSIVQQASVFLNLPSASRSSP